MLPIGRVQRLVALSLPPCKIILLLYQTVHVRLANRTLHPAAVRKRMPNKEATDDSRMMWHVRVTRSPLMLRSHMCVDVTLRPLASETFRGQVLRCLLMMGVPSITMICVASESAMASFGLSLKMAPAKAGAEEEMVVLWEERVLDATPVISL